MDIELAREIVRVKDIKMEILKIIVGDITGIKNHSISSYFSVKYAAN